MNTDNALATTTTVDSVEKLLVMGDLSALKPEQRLEYYRKVCDSLALNPLTKPFEYITLNGKLTLYARKDATDQLRNSRKVSITRLEREKIDDIYTVTAYAQTPDGRQDSSIGAVSISNLRGEALANAIMKAETKSKRRVTLSICGLGMLDETELETIPAQALQQPVTVSVIDPSKARPLAAPAPINGKAREAEIKAEIVQDAPEEPPVDDEWAKTASAVQHPAASAVPAPTEWPASVLQHFVTEYKLKANNQAANMLNLSNLPKDAPLPILEAWVSLYKENRATGTMTPQEAGNLANEQLDAHLAQKA